MKFTDKIGLLIGVKLSKIFIAQVLISAITTTAFVMSDITAQSAGHSYATEAKVNELVLVQGNSLTAVSNPVSPVSRTSLATKVDVVRRIPCSITGYSSTVGQTDDTPFTTASNKMVADGVIANNGLPFGTKVKIPAIYGDKIFEVQDRMNKRYDSDHFDIWFEQYSDAKNFGKRTTYIEVLDE